jgi:hypothetical protein
MVRPQICPSCKAKFVPRRSKMPRGLIFDDILDYQCSVCLEDYRNHGDSNDKQPPSKFEGFRISGVEIRCLMCRHTGFSKRQALLDGRWPPFPQLDSRSDEATCFICDKCGYIHWFLPLR